MRLPVHHIRCPCSNKQPTSFQATQRKQISCDLFYLTLVSSFLTKWYTNWKKGYPIFQTEAHKPYPELNGGQIRRPKGLSVPRHRGLGEECTTFFRKGARSSLAANSEYSKRTTIDAQEKRRRIWKRRSKNEGTPAKRTTIDALNERSRKTKKTRS